MNEIQKLCLDHLLLPVAFLHVISLLSPPTISLGLFCNLSSYKRQNKPKRTETTGNVRGLNNRLTQQCQYRYRTNGPDSQGSIVRRKGKKISAHISGSYQYVCILHSVTSGFVTFCKLHFDLLSQLHEQDVEKLINARLEPADVSQLHSRNSYSAAQP